MQKFEDWLSFRLGLHGASSLKAFQKAKGLKQSGKADEPTVKALRASPVAAPVAAATVTIPAHMRLAIAELGVKEIVGPKHNARVVKYFADAGNAGIKNDEVPWCGAFVGAILKRAGLDNEVPVSLRLWARGYLRLGKALNTPVYGCVAVKERGPASGHVGFVVAANASSVWLIGGNQGNAVSIAKFARATFLGFRQPSGVPVAGLPKLPASAAGATNPSQS